MPGPTGLPIVGTAPQLMNDPFDFLLSCHRKYGDIFRVPLPVWGDMVFVAHPELAVQVMHDHGERFGTPDPPAALTRRTGLGLPLLDGAQYTERRNVIAPMFGKRYLRGLYDVVLDEFSARLERWDSFAGTGRVVDLEHELSMVVLPGFLRAMFSLSVTDEQLQQYDRDLRRTLSAWSSFMLWRRPPDLLPIPGGQNLPAALHRLTRSVGQLLDERRSNPETQHDLLQVLADGHLKDGSLVPRPDALFDTLGLMVAGYDTVVAAMSWMLALLPTNPEATSKLYAEIDTLGGVNPTAVDLDKLTWARACFDEAQRLQGHPGFGRMSKVDQELAGYSIPRKTIVQVCFSALHRDPRWWTNPTSFDPNHFADRAQVAARPKTAFIPFGTGPHQCVGSALAYVNALTLTTLIFQRYQVNLQPGWTPRHHATTSTTIKGGLPVTISRR